MERFVYDDYDKEMEIVLSNEHSLKPSTINPELHTIFVHQKLPLMVTIIGVGDSLDSTDSCDFKKLSIDGQEFFVRALDPDYWRDFLARLPGIISKHRSAAKFEKDNSIVSNYSFSPDIFVYLNRAVDNMSRKDKYPLKCPYCDFKLEIDCDLSGGFDFGDHSIKGFRFFECDSCKGPIDKVTIIKGMRSVLLSWVDVLDAQEEFFECPPANSSNRDGERASDDYNSSGGYDYSSSGDSCSSRLSKETKRKIIRNEKKQRKSPYNLRSRD